MKPEFRKQGLRFAVASALLAGAGAAQADAITDWNTKAGEMIVAAKMGTPPAVRLMAIVQTAVQEAVEAAGAGRAAPPAIDAAVAAANRAALGKLLPSQQAAVDAAYTAALAQIADGPAKAAGIAAGEKAAAAVIARRADDGAAVADAYRPHANVGAYVPTVTPAVPHWGQRKPWLMASPAQFRPGPPPALTSVAWARDYNEVKAIGARNSTLRSAEQNEIARFWEFSLPSIYFGVVRSVAQMPGRDAGQNARLYAAAGQAMDDALIGVFEAKYHYNFWRPATAIRNGDADGNDATERDAAWAPFIDAPLHPEYPSAHSTLAGAVSAVLKAALGNGPVPVLETSSPTAKGVTRRWGSLEAFTREVADARVYEGIHYRTSVEVGTALGERIGGLAAKHVQSPL